MDKIKKYILPAIILIVAVVFSVLITKSCSKPKVVERVVTVTETFTNVEYDTVYLKEVKVEKFKVTDTLYLLRDSLFEIVDSVNVEIPVSSYEVNKIFENDSSDLKIHLMMSGYNVSLDTLSYELNYRFSTVQTAKKKHRIGFYVGPSVVFGYDPINKKFAPNIGIGIMFGISLKKM